MPNPIPTRSREVVASRDAVCVRCGQGRNLQWHHRRSRRVRDGHTHCACVGVRLCMTCHSWVHTNPQAATKRGLLMSVHEQSPWTVPVDTFYGQVEFTCDGMTLFHAERSDDERD